MAQTIRQVTYELTGPEVPDAAFTLKVAYPSRGQVLRTPFISEGQIVSWVRLQDDPSKDAIRIVHGFGTGVPAPGHLTYLSSLDIEGTWYHLFL
jgi:hypothetical protein